MGSAKRTPAGAPTAAARTKFGAADGSFPVMDRKSAVSAINLRHNGKTETPQQVLNRVSRWAGKNSDDTVKAKVAAARKEDRSR